MKKIITWAIVLIWLGVLSSSSVFACSCLKPESPQKELEKSTSVFVWKVTDISWAKKEWSQTQQVSYPKTINFAVTQNFKWVNGKTITLKTANNSAMCGYDFEKWKEYLVYTNKYNVYLCSRTALAENNKDIEILTKNAKKVYNTKAEFEKAEWKTCASATDGCNNYIMKDGKVSAGTQMYCEDIYGKNGQEKWSCTSEKITSKEEFIKKHWKTCETATDGVNTFFWKDLSASTMIAYPKDFTANWKCLKLKKDTSSKADFIKKYWNTCELATDGVNKFFGKNFENSTRIWYPENFVANWKCLKEKEQTMCAAVYQPVCWVDWKTYSNSCVAGKVSVDYEWKCLKVSKSQQEKIKKIFSKFLNKLAKYPSEKKIIVLQKLVKAVESVRSKLSLRSDLIAPKKIDILDYLKIQAVKELNRLWVKNSQNVKNCDGKNSLEQCKK